MAVAHDAAIELVRTNTANPFSWTHVPVGTPRGVVVYLDHDTSATDHVTGVTYGGVSMAPRVVRATDATGELGATEMWFLGSSIPTGNQTVEVTLSSGTGDNFHCVSVSITASADTEVVDFDSISGDASDPQVTLSYGGRTCISYVGAHLGGSNIADYGEVSGQESVHTHDWGILQSQFSRQTTPGTSDFTAGWTRTQSDDVALVAVAVSEVAGGGGFTGTAALTVPAPVVAATAAEEFAGSGALGVTPPVVSGTGEEVFTGSGALAVTAPVVAASATETFSGSAALPVTPPVVEATGDVFQPITGTAALDVLAPVVEATGNVLQPITGTADLGVSPPVVEGTGDVLEAITGSGDLSVDPPGIGATGGVANPGGAPEPASGGGGPRPRRFVYDLKPPKQTEPEKPKRRRVQYRIGEATFAVRTPVVVGRGTVQNPEPRFAKGRARVPVPAIKATGTNTPAYEVLRMDVDTLLALLTEDDD